MIKCTVISPFYDLVEKVSRSKGGTFFAEQERAEHLVSLNLVTAEGLVKTTEKKTKTTAKKAVKKTVKK